MPRRTQTYAIRLAVEGGGQVRADLVSVGQSGEQSLKRIETAGDRASGGLKGLGRQAELLRTGLRTLGGALIGVTALNLQPLAYFQETQHALWIITFVGGLIKSAVYGAVVAVVGCLRGLQCGRSSAAVGLATTSAVVTSIVFIIVSMAILTVIYNVIGI